MIELDISNIQAHCDELQNVAASWDGSQGPCPLHTSITNMRLLIAEIDRLMEPGTAYAIGYRQGRRWADLRAKIAECERDFWRKKYLREQTQGFEVAA